MFHASQWLPTMAELDVCGQATLQKDKQFQKGLTQLCLPFLILSDILNLFFMSQEVKTVSN